MASSIVVAIVKRYIDSFASMAASPAMTRDGHARIPRPTSLRRCLMVVN
jgi:hypothetical protein